METFSLKVITPLGEVFNDEVKSVNLPGSEGDFGVYPKHASLLSTLKPGIMKITTKDDTPETVIITWGYVKVSEHKVQVLIDEAIAIEGSDNSSIIESVNASKELIKKALADDVMMTTLGTQIESIAKDIM